MQVFLRLLPEVTGQIAAAEERQLRVGATVLETYMQALQHCHSLLTFEHGKCGVNQLAESEDMRAHTAAEAFRRGLVLPPLPVFEPARYQMPETTLDFAGTAASTLFPSPPHTT